MKKPRSVAGLFFKFCSGWARLATSVCTGLVGRIGEVGRRLVGAVVVVVADAVCIVVVDATTAAADVVRDDELEGDCRLFERRAIW